jgi:hypothetical protein
VRTTLYCTGCGKRCGSAETLAGDADLVHVTTYNVKRRGSLYGLPVHVTRGQTLRLSDPEGWPLTWRCEECRTTVVRLDREAARAVGIQKNLGLGSMPVDN